MVSKAHLSPAELRVNALNGPANQPMLAARYSQSGVFLLVHLVCFWFCGSVKALLSCWAGFCEYMCG